MKLYWDCQYTQFIVGIIFCAGEQITIILCCRGIAVQRYSLFGKLKKRGLNHTIRVKRVQYCGIFHSIDTLKPKEKKP